MGRSDHQPPEPALVPVRRVGHDAAASDDAIHHAVSILNQGGVIAIPTDTVYGVAASIELPASLARLYTIKGRPEDRPLPVLLAGVAHLDMVAAPLDDRLKVFLDRFWPGGLTVAVPALPHVPPPVTARDGTVGVRVPNHPVTLALLQAAGGALAVTSANRSGQPAATSPAGAIAALGSRLDLVLDAGEAPGGEASTVIGVKQGRLVLYRPGVIAWSNLRQTWEELGGQVVVPGPGTVG